MWNKIFQLRKYFCRCEDLTKKNSSFYLYEKLKSQQTFREFFKTYFEISGNYENENFLLLEKLVDKGKFESLFQSYSDETLNTEIENNREISDDKTFKNTVLLYFKYLGLKSEICLFDKIDNAKIKKNFLKFKLFDFNLLSKIISKKFEQLNLVQFYFKKKLFEKKYFESLSKLKMTKLFENLSLSIINLIILFCLKIKFFKKEYIEKIIFYLQDLKALNDNFFRNKSQKSDFKQKYFKLNNFHLVNLQNDLQIYSTEICLENFKNNLTKVLLFLIKEFSFSENQDYLIFEIKNFLSNRNQKIILSIINEEDSKNDFSSITGSHQDKTPKQRNFEFFWTPANNKRSNSFCFQSNNTQQTSINNNTDPSIN
jgi:hypothetical protein